MRYSATGSFRRKRATQNAELQKAIQKIKEAALRHEPKLMTRAPWLDNNKNVIWGPWRIFLAKIMLSQNFESFMGLIILGNILLMWMETDYDAQCYPESQWKTIDECPYLAGNHWWINITNRVLLVVYTIEVIFRFIVDRMEYFYIKWNWLDLSVVVAGWSAEVLDGVISLNFLRAFRVARLLRAARILLAVRELYLLMTGLTNSMRTILYGTMFLIAMLVLSSIVVVQILHPINAELEYSDCPRCNKGFSSVWNSSLTLFQQIVAGDSWGQISIPVIEARPWLGGPILISIIIMVGLGLMNLILAVIVERAAEAREQDVLNRAKQKEKDRLKTMLELANLCADMDEDGNGSLSLSELLYGYDQSEQFKSLMRIMDVQREDLERVFKNLMFTEATEHQAPSSSSEEINEAPMTITYMQFCEQLHRVQSRDLRMMMLEVSSTLYELAHNFKGFKEEQARHNLLTSRHQARMAATLDAMNLNNSSDGQMGSVASKDKGVVSEQVLQTSASVPILRARVSEREKVKAPMGASASENIRRDMSNMSSNSLGRSMRSEVSFKGISSEVSSQRLQNLAQAASVAQIPNPNAATPSAPAQSSVNAPFQSMGGVPIEMKPTRLPEDYFATQTGPPSVPDCFTPRLGPRGRASWDHTRTPSPPDHSDFHEFVGNETVFGLASRTGSKDTSNQHGSDGKSSESVKAQRVVSIGTEVTPHSPRSLLDEEESLQGVDNVNGNALSLLSSDLLDLRRYFEGLQKKKTDLMKRLEAQVAMLSMNAQQVVDMQHTLRQPYQTPEGDVAIAPTNEELMWFREQIKDIEENMGDEWETTLGNIKDALEEEDGNLMAAGVRVSALSGRFDAYSPAPTGSRGRAPNSKSPSGSGAMTSLASARLSRENRLKSFLEDLAAQSSSEELLPKSVTLAPNISARTQGSLMRQHSMARTKTR